MKIPPNDFPLIVPSEARANWWVVGVFDLDGSLLDVRNIVVPEQRLADAITAARWVMTACRAEHMVIETMDQARDTLYEERAGVVVTNRLGTGGGGR